MSKQRTMFSSKARIFSWIAVISLLVGVLPPQSNVFAPHQASAADTLPDDPGYIQALDAAVNPWSFFEKECTSFVAYVLSNTSLTYRGNHFTNYWGRAQDSQGRTWDRFDNAQYWDEYAAAIGFAVNQTPAVGAVAQWNSNSSIQNFVAGSEGHVAIVRAVAADGSVTIEDYNGTGGDHLHGSRSGVKAENYIHFERPLPGGWWNSESTRPATDLSTGQGIHISVHAEDNGNGGSGGGLSDVKITLYNPTSSSSWSVLKDDTSSNVLRKSTADVAVDYTVPSNTQYFRVSFDVYSKNQQTGSVTKQLAPNGVWQFCVRNAPNCPQQTAFDIEQDWIAVSGLGGGGAPVVVGPTPAGSSSGSQVPTLLSPADGITIQQGETQTFSWSNTGAGSYKFEAWNDSGPGSYTHTGPGTSLQFAPTDPGAWRWQVRSVDANGVPGDAPHTRSFLVGTPIGVTLYENSNYGGLQKTYQYSSNDACIPLGDMNDRANSLRFEGGYAGNYVAILFADASCGSYLARYDGDFPDFGMLNDSFSSLQIQRIDGVTLCTDANFQGTCKTFGVGSSGSLNGLEGQVSSIRNPNAAYHVILYDQAGGQGTPGYYDSDTAQLEGYWNDRARSIRVEKHNDTSCNPTSDGVILYRDHDFRTGGGCLNVITDIPDLDPYTYANAPSSMKIVGSYRGLYQVEFYDDPNYGHFCGAFWQNQEDLRGCGNTVRSVKIVPYVAPTPIPTEADTTFSGNVATNAYRYPENSGAAVDGDLGTDWASDNATGPALSFSWAAPVKINHIIVWDRTQPDGGGSISLLTLAFSDGTTARNIDMIVAGPHCADIIFPTKTVSWVEVIPWGGGHGFREVEIWATTGQQQSPNACINARAVTPTAESVSEPPVVATTYPAATAQPITDLIVSTDPSESSDGQAHGSDNPFVIPVDASYDSVLIKTGAYATSPRWNGSTGGVTRFSATGAVQVDGVLTMDGKGYRGGSQVVGAGGGIQGESYTGLGGQSSAANGGGGGGGMEADSGGAGGGYGSPGQVPPGGTRPVFGGDPYGDPSASTAYMGSGGGSSGAQSANFGGAGGTGGGVISIHAATIVVNGRISANGGDGGSAGDPNNLRGGGGGSGGTVVLHADVLQVGDGLVTALGGHGGLGSRNGQTGPYSGGDGGVGRIALEWGQSVAGSTNPAANASYVAPPAPGLPSLVVSTDPAESSDRQAHDASNPYLIPLDAAYENVWIKAGAYASAAAWNGSAGGVLRFSATGEVRIDGVLTMDGKGYRGGPSVQGADDGRQGESYTGRGGKSNQPNGGGGGGGAGADSGGGGGGYGSPGQNAVNGSDIPPSYGGNAYGDTDLSTLYPGSGGGSAGAQSANIGGAGGNGGGVIDITGGTIVVTGQISANGFDGGSAGDPHNPRGGGGGSGGSIRLRADSLQIGVGLVTAIGGHGGYGTRDGQRPASGGDGGAGRIRLEYATTLSGTSNPPAGQASYTPATATPTPTSTPTLTPTATATPVGMAIADSALVTGIESPEEIHPGEVVGLLITAHNPANTDAASTWSWDVYDASGNRIDALSVVDVPVAVAPGPLTMALYRVVPEPQAPGTYRFVGTVLSGASVTSQTALFTISEAPLDTPTPTPTDTAVATATETFTPEPTATATDTATPTPTPTTSNTPTSVSTADQGIELLTGTWAFAGNNGADEHDLALTPDVLSGKTAVRVAFDFHGTSFGGGDDEASLVFVQNGEWFVYNLATHGQNGFDGPQSLTVPLNAFHQFGNESILLDPAQSVSNLHARFWNSGPFTVDMSSVFLIAASNSATPATATPTATATATPQIGPFLVDAFSGSQPDLTTWNTVVRGTGASVQTTNGRLEIQFAANSTDGTDGMFGAWLRQTCVVRGDFEAQVDYQLLDWPATNGVRLALQADIGTPAIERDSFGAGEFAGQPKEVYFSDFPNGWSLSETADRSGSLRLVRVGDTVMGFFLQPGGWVQIGQSPVSATDVPVTIGAWSGSNSFGNQAVRVAFDNFQINKGTLVGCGASAATPTDTPTESPSPTNTAMPTETATNTPEPTPTATPTESPSPTATETETATGTPTPTATDTATNTPTETPTKTATATETFTPTPTDTATFTPTATPSATETPSPTVTPSETPTQTPTATETPTFTATATDSPTSTATATPSPTDTATPTETATPVPSETPTLSPTATDSPTDTATPTHTPTSTPTATDTPSATATVTDTPTLSPTTTPTFTPSPSPTVTTTPTATPSRTPLPTSTPTRTATPRPSVTPTRTPSPRPSATPTRTPTPRPTATRTPTPRVTATATPVRTVTRTPTPRPAATATRTPTPRPTATSTKTATPRPTATPTRTPTPRVAAAENADSPTATAAPAEAAGTLVVRAKDHAGTSLPGACFALRRGRATIDERCDKDDGKEDGVTTLVVAPGSYELVETKAPAGYATAKPHTVRVVADNVRKTTVRHTKERGPSETPVTAAAALAEPAGSRAFRWRSPRPGTG